MEYKGYVLEHSEAYDHVRGWHHYGVIININDLDFTCVGGDLDELEETFKQLVDDNFDVLQSLTGVLEVDLDQTLIDQLLELDGYQGLGLTEIVTRILMEKAKELIEENE